MQPFCCQCQVFMLPHHNGVGLIIKDGTGAPYQLYFGDEYACPVCGNKIITGYGDGINRYANNWQYHYTRAKTSGHCYEEHTHD